MDRAADGSVRDIRTERPRAKPLPGFHPYAYVFGLLAIFLAIGAAVGFRFARNVRGAAFYGSLPVLVPAICFFALLIGGGVGYPVFYEMLGFFLWFVPVCILGAVVGGWIKERRKRKNGSTPKAP